MIDLLDISQEETWPQSKRTNYKQLKVISARIVEKGADITQGNEQAQKDVVNVYAHYATDDAKMMCNKVLQLRGDKYNESMVDVLWQKYSTDNQLKGNNKLVKICKDFGIDTTIDDSNVNDADELAAYIPADVDPKFVLEHGFYPTKNGGRTGYYFRTGDKTFTAQSNFILEPLMHVLSKTDNKRIIAVDNGNKRAVLDLPSRALISVEQFTGFCYEEGNYVFWGGKMHLMKIVMSLNERFPVCYELKTLGWQPEGFFAWSNAVYNDKAVQEFNDLGIASVNDTNYFSPSASEIYKGQRAEDDQYENDRFLTYKLSPVTFSDWCVMFHKVYPQQSIYGIGFIFIGLFKDCIYKIDNNCPHLSAYGEKGSGKSKFAESVSAVFLNDLQPFNLNHGTDFAFFNRLGRFRNCVTWYDEFDDQAIKEDRFQSIKGAYDGAGRERGKGTNKNKTEVSKVNSALLLTGQYLSTRDDNAALTRCIILAFTPDNDRSNDSIAAYERLKDIEKKGITSVLTEILQHRHAFEKDYGKTFPDTFSELREMIREAGGEYKERVLRNYTAILNCFRFFCQHIQFPFTLDAVKKQCAKDVMRLSTMISESDSLADFWNTVVYLMETGEIYEGFHYRIIVVPHISIRKEKGAQPKQQNFPKPTKILCIRLTTIHKMYLEAHKRQTGRTGINQQSLELYISSAKGYYGRNDSMQFTDRETGNVTNTSSYIFDYELLGVPLEQSAPEQEKIIQSIEGVLDGEIKHEMVAGVPKLKYRIVNQVTTNVAGQPFTSFERTTCYDAVLSNEGAVLSNQRLVVTGTLKLNNWVDKEGNKQLKRTMEVDNVRVKDEAMSLNFPKDDDKEALPF